MRTEQLLGMSRPVLTEIFEFQDEDDYECAIFLVLSSARVWSSIILAGKRDSRRHSNMGFLRVSINTDIRAVRLEKFVIVMMKQLIITIRKFSNLIGYQLPWFQP